MPMLDGPRRRGWRAGTLVSGAATAVVVAALVVAATGGVPTAAARLGATTASTTAKAGGGGPRRVPTQRGRPCPARSSGHGTTSSPSKGNARGAKATTTTTPKSGPSVAGSGTTNGAIAGNSTTGTTDTSDTTDTTDTPVPGAGADGSAPQPGESTNPNLPCQGTTPLGLPGTWTCTFDDEFNGTVARYEQLGPAAHVQQRLRQRARRRVTSTTPTRSRCRAATLNLSVRQVAPFTCSYPGGSFTTSYEAGMVSTYGLFDQTYGAFEVSAKLPAATISGLQETMWLYPQNLDVRGVAELGRDRLRRVLQPVPRARRALRPLRRFGE